MAGRRSFEELLDEAAAVAVEGWDFSWFCGRATEERPPWGYAGILADRLAGTSTALDIQTGGGELLAAVPRLPTLLVATESWSPNVAIAHRTLAPRGAWVVHTDEDADLPFASASFDLVVSRHPVVTHWPEIARLLRPGGTYLSQQVGAGSMRELTDALMGPQPVGQRRRGAGAVASAIAAGLDVVDFREATLPAVFDDIAAVVVFLRTVVWTVPDFTVDRYRRPLHELHDRMEREGPFVAHAERFLIEAQKPL
ncbi:MAG TPA: class I SAM-dependent methyltransferase [Acidimicrobiales bacterium]|nr:class I SAM-dependent methyltransferase [Acidimicrobiales bacterium]